MRIGSPSVLDDVDASDEAESLLSARMNGGRSNAPPSFWTSSTAATVAVGADGSDATAGAGWKNGVESCLVSMDSWNVPNSLSQMTVCCSLV